MYNTDIRTGTAKSGYKKYYGIYMDIYSTNTQESGRPDTIAADADKGIKADKGKWTANQRATGIAGGFRIQAKSFGSAFFASRRF